MVLVDDFREIWNCTSWLKKIVWIQPEIKREHGTTEALTFPFGRLKFEKRARDVEKEGVILSLTQQRRGVIRCALCITISFPFLSAIINQNKDAKLVPNSHPFSIEYPHQSITLAFFPSIPCFFSWLLNNKLSSRITTLSTNHQKKWKKQQVRFFSSWSSSFSLVFVLFCFVCCTSFLEYWNGFCCFIWNLQVYPKVKVREQDDQEDFKGPSLFPLNDDSSFPGITCSSLSYFFFLNFLFIINLI